MDFIEIQGYKSIKEAKVELRPVNILIGANGAGKSNFISFFDFLNNVYNQKLKEYVALRGIHKLLHKGQKITQSIYTNILYDNETDAYSFSILLGEEGFIFSEEDLWCQNNHWDFCNLSAEAQIKNKGLNKANYIRNHLENLKKYHFHDTSNNSPFTETCHIDNDSYFLYETGKNISALLFRIQQRNQIVYSRIIKTIQSIAPFFSDFFFQPNSEGLMRLQWQDKYSSTVYGANDLSDGTLRFIALAVLFMQPNLPDSIIIDEPELGLHPLAIAKFAGMVKSVAKKGAQVIIATQSTDLISYFEPEDIITVNQIDGESKFKRLKKEDLSVWLEDYTLGELWQRNIITDGQPKQ